MSTRIVDLPDNANNMPSLHPGSQGVGQFAQANANTYSPINIHPNPYGYEDSTANITGIPTSSTRDSSLRGGGTVGNNNHQQNPHNEMYYDMADQGTYLASQNSLTQEQIQQIQGTPYHQIPSRDIHISKTEYTHDQRTTANYIPPLSTYQKDMDYVKEHEIDNEKKKQEHQQKKKKSAIVDIIFQNIQYPLMISILFFIFQYPLIDLFLFKRLSSFLPLYESDGTMNLYGKAAKSALFGMGVFSILKTTEYIASI